MNIWKSYIWTAPVSERSRVQIPYRPEFFLICSILDSSMWSKWRLRGFHLSSFCAKSCSSAKVGQPSLTLSAKIIFKGKLFLWILHFGCSRQTKLHFSKLASWLIRARSWNFVLAFKWRFQTAIVTIKDHSYRYYAFDLWCFQILYFPGSNDSLTESRKRKNNYELMLFTHSQISI